MSFLKSDDIKIFPFGSNRISDPNSRALSERNITDLVKKLTDNHSYVVSYDEWKHVIEFVLGGYLITANIEGLSNPLYASIKLDNNILSGGDDGDGEFTGVTFTTNSVTDVTYILQLLDESGAVPNASYLKFAGRSFSIGKIDCGTSSVTID